jgi:hypothetical protein
VLAASGWCLLRFIILFLEKCTVAKAFGGVLAKKNSISVFTCAESAIAVYMRSTMN